MNIGFRVIGKKNRSVVEKLRRVCILLYVFSGCECEREDEMQHDRQAKQQI